MAYKLTTPRTLAQRVKRLISKGDESRDFAYDDRDIIPIIIDVANAIIKRDFFQFRDQELTKASDSHYVQTYNNVDVKINKVTGKNFIEHLATYVYLQGNMGVQRIAPLTDNVFSRKGMIPINANEMDIFEPILGEMQNQWVYEVQGDKALFHKKCGKTLCEAGILKVSVTEVVSIPGLEADTPFPAPPENHIEIVEEARRILLNNPPKDLKNDNSPNRVDSNIQ